MERRIGITSGIHPPGIIWGVLRGIPPALREVYSAYKGNSIIHDHDLLVVRGADRMVSVQPEMNAPMGLPLEIENGKQLPLQRVDHGEIPIQYMYIQAWLPRNRGIQHLLEFYRQIMYRFIAQQADAAVDIPAHDKDGVSCPCNRSG